MTDKEWADALADIVGLRYQLTNNILPADERENTKQLLKIKLERLAKRDMP